MFDEVDRLHESPELVRLLIHYAELGAADRHVWQDRLMELQDTTAKDLTRLHGELIAYDWVDQNTGTVVLGKPGVVAGCYRVTLNGLRALKRFQAGPEAELEDEIVGANGPEPVEKKPRRKREPKPVKPAVAANAADAQADAATADTIPSATSTEGSATAA